MSNGFRALKTFIFDIYYAKVVLLGVFHGTAFSLISPNRFYHIQRNRNYSMVVDDCVRSLFEDFVVKNREISNENYRDKIDSLFEMEYQAINENI